MPVAIDSDFSLLNFLSGTRRTVLFNYCSIMRSLILTLLFVSCWAHALEKDLTNALESVAGIYSSIYVHELGHGLAYAAFGATDISIEVPRKDSIFSGVTTAKFTEPVSAGRRQVISASGLIASSMAGELVLQRRGLHSSPYAQAVLGTAVVANLRHVYSYYTRIRGVDGYLGNDIDGFELAGGNPHIFSALLVAYSLSALHRMKKENIPLFYVNMRF